MSAAERLPGWLASYVVDQRYDAYDEEDHEVWRTVMRGISERLAETAHPIYLEGLERTGIRLDRIPRIEEMDRCLAHFGWGAVCVDGFIPPRAFQELQALRILPISAAIRTKEHLDYTPAPDILHEAAGHAPILADPDYAAFLQRIGEMGARTFSLPGDRAVFEAIRHLSIVKEERSADAVRIAAAEDRLTRAIVANREVSEAAEMARLYWWTVEYGLVGTTEDYRLYGAGLLSSLGESERCHRAEVDKVPLTPSCVEVPYDITREQPQLFVVPSFADLHRVLDEVMENKACRRGGRHALDVAASSGERAVVTFASGARVVGTLEEGMRVGARKMAYRLVEDVRMRRAPEGEEEELLQSVLCHTPHSVCLYRLDRDRRPSESALARAERLVGSEALGHAVLAARPAMPGRR